MPTSKACPKLTMAETILITGGAGFIGSHLAQRLVDDGYRVVVVDNLSSYYSPAKKRANLKGLLKLKKFSFYKVDVRNKRELNQVLAKEKTRQNCAFGQRGGSQAII